MTELIVVPQAAHWQRLKRLVLDSVSSPITRRVYNLGLDEFFEWYGRDPRPGFTKATVAAWRVALEARGLGAVSINVRITAVRKLAVEAADNGLLAPELASGIVRVKGVASKGVRLGNWLTVRQAQTLLNAPDATTTKGLRDRAILAVLLGCGLRRSEVAALATGHVQQRDGRWCIVDLRGKHGRVRTVPMPAWVKVATDAWTSAAGIADGYVFRPVNRAGQAQGVGLSEKVVWQLLQPYAAAAGVPGIAPHDCRRTCAKLCRAAGGELEQIQLLLGHASVQTTERYLGTKQDLELFGFTGTPIFEENASYQQIEGEQASYRTTDDLFQRCLHQYTITHAIEDRNVLRFHIDYYKPEGKNKPKPGEAVAKGKVIETILAKHDAATAGRKFNAILATNSINDAIEYFEKFTAIRQKQADDPDIRPLNIACVFSPPAEGNKDVQQIQEDLPQEKADNQQDPEAKKAALEAIIDHYNARYGTNHRISDFDLYYQDVQKRIKDQQYPNADLPHAQKIDIVIVVDMLLTGFDSKYLNTLYVDKNLKHHGLIQAFSRTNRVLNDTKPYGNILDFRQQQQAVEDAIALFSGEKIDQAREIWLVDPAPKVIEKLQTAVQKLGDFMQSQGLSNAPEDVPNLKGDAARGQFVTLFKEVQRLKTQLDQYTDLSDEQEGQITQIVPPAALQGFRSVYLETAQRLKEKQDKPGDAATPEVQQLDFEFVLFASAIVDYDYIMGLIARYTQEQPDKLKLNREELIGLIQSDAKFLDEREDIAEYIRSLKANQPLDEKEIRAGYERFKAEKKFLELSAIADKHGLDSGALQAFVDEVLRRRIFDGEQLSDLTAPLGLGWKARTQKELVLMEDLGPLLHKLALGREISGLSAYEQ